MDEPEMLQKLAAQIDAIRAILPGYAITLLCRNEAGDNKNWVIGQDTTEQVATSLMAAMKASDCVDGFVASDGYYPDTRALQ